MLTAQNITLTGRLSGVSAALQPGEITAICGPNGAGKSSLLGCLAGLLEPDSGVIELGEADLATLSPKQRARTIGYLPQTAELAWDVSVQTLAGLGRLPWDDADAAPVAAALAALDLAALAQRPVSKLSGGERARALLARVLAGQPRWLLADEPLAALDLAHQLAMLRQFRALADAGTGVVMVLHDLALAMNHADRVLVLDHGQLAVDGTPPRALTSDILARVWGVDAVWTGFEGRRALVLGQLL